MKKASFYVLVATALSMTACEKIYDLHIPNPQVAKSNCRVSQLTFYFDGYSALYNVSYDKKGNVTSMVTNEVKFPGGTSYYYRYDNKNRLTDQLDVYVGATDPISWHSYIYYPDKIMDTTYGYEGRFTDTHPPYNAQNKRWSMLTTDAHGRITREIEFIPLSVPPTTNLYTDTIYYNYNKDGNLIFAPPFFPAIYDNKINLYSTNPAWQLAHRDYSVNNATDNFFISSTYPQIVKYNAYGLPVKYVKPSYSGHWFVLFGRECDSLEVTYDCDIPTKKNY